MQNTLNAKLNLLPWQQGKTSDQPKCLVGEKFQQIYRIGNINKLTVFGLQSPARSFILSSPVPVVLMKSLASGIVHILEQISVLISYKNSQIYKHIFLIKIVSSLQFKRIQAFKLKWRQKCQHYFDIRQRTSLESIKVAFLQAEWCHLFALWARPC